MNYTFEKNPNKQTKPNYFNMTDACVLHGFLNTFLLFLVCC